MRVRACVPLLYLLFTFTLSIILLSDSSPISRQVQPLLWCRQVKSSLGYPAKLGSNLIFRGQASHETSSRYSNLFEQRSLLVVVCSSDNEDVNEDNDDDDDDNGNYQD